MAASSLTRGGGGAPSLNVDLRLENEDVLPLD